MHVSAFMMDFASQITYGMLHSMSTVLTDVSCLSALHTSAVLGDNLLR